MNTFEISDEDKLIAEFESDTDEAADAALEDLLKESAAGPETRIDTLVNKLKHAPDGSFMVSEHSQYSAPIWLLHEPAHDFPAKVRLDRELPGSNDLKRALAYYLIPQFSPQGNIRSFNTTKSRAYEYTTLEDFVFKPNNLTARPEDLKLITAAMLNRALEAAKKSDAKRKFVALFFYIRFWRSLSIQKLIPKELSLDIDLKNVDTHERYQEVRNLFNGAIQSWIPYSESELEHLMNFAFFWTEEALPYLLDARAFIHINNYDKIVGWSISRKLEIPEFSKYFDIELKGERVLRYTKNIRNDPQKPGTIFYNYTWVQHYGAALDKVRNAIFILVALITGARKSELSRIRLEDVWRDDIGLYWIKITRFKTAEDPVYEGEEDILPLPEFIGKKIDAYKLLKSIGPFAKQNWLFQANLSVKTVNKATPALINAIVIQLKEALPIDRIHAHRFRKTIAEILINRDERHIELIRLLFGHKSYAMTLRYISRNPYLVRGVAQALEESFAHDFHEVIKGVRDGSYSGSAAERIATQISSRPKEFTGQRLRLSIMVYISHLLLEGESVFIGRTAVGTYCITGEHFTKANPPPCISGRPYIDEYPVPDPTNCQIHCCNAVVLQKAKRAIEENIAFYTSVLIGNSEHISAKAEAGLRQKILALELHLNNLNSNSRALDRIEAHEVV